MLALATVYMHACLSWRCGYQRSYGASRGHAASDAYGILRRHQPAAQVRYPLLIVAGQSLLRLGSLHEQSFECLLVTASHLSTVHLDYARRSAACTVCGDLEFLISVPRGMLALTS